MKKFTVMFVCGAKDFHAMDKYFRLVNALGNEKVLLVTDTLSGEGQLSLLKKDSNYSKLLIIDRFTLKNLSRIGNIIRNFYKLLFIPFQAFLLKKKWLIFKPQIVHAAPIYYMLLAYFAGIPYIGTPQAGEILERSKRNIFYRLFAKLAIKNANKIIVDSHVLSNEIHKTFGVKSSIIRNGFDSNYALSFQKLRCEKKRLLSIRGIQSNYQLIELIRANKKNEKVLPIDFVYPFKDSNYFSFLKKNASLEDNFIGKLDKSNLYQLMSNALLTISIPDSDSSPRSVYEAIFCGSIVAITNLPFLKELPSCMMSRIFIVDIHNNFWLQEAIKFAELNYHIKYIPSQSAFEFCDQMFLTKKIISDIYEI